jgi:glycosyltransferase involved in cell wall biosynthesis
MKLIIQIPCFNETATLAETVRDLPREIPGVDRVEVLVIDDGSTDGTSELARSIGVDHVVRFAQNRGLAKGFMAGLDACLRLGADVIVNTDADNQYCAADIPELVRPIIEGRTDIVVGDRQVENVAHFSKTKKKLQRFGSWVVRLASNTNIPDATSGFRAISREAAQRLFVTSEFTYTLETIIQAGQAHLSVSAVPIRTNPKTRESRLFRSIPQYLRRSASTILRIYTMYRPLKAFFLFASLLFFTGTGLGLRFLYYHFTETKTGHVQSLILTAILVISAFMVLLVGLLADLVAANRKILEDVLMRLRRIEYGPPRATPTPEGAARAALPAAEAKAKVAPPPGGAKGAEPGDEPEPP